MIAFALLLGIGAAVGGPSPVRAEVCDYYHDWSKEIPWWPDDDKHTGNLAYDPGEEVDVADYVVGAKFNFHTSFEDDHTLEASGSDFHSGESCTQGGGGGGT